MNPPTHEQTCLSIFNYVQFSVERREGGQRIHATGRCGQEQPIWILATQRLAIHPSVMQNILSVSSSSPQRKTKKKQQECKRFDSNWSGYYAAICIICSKGTERLGESWLEKMSQWIHISAATDWTWSFPNEPRGPMKKVFRWWEKKTRERGRKERRAGWTPSLHPFSFHRGIKSSMLDFQWSERIIPEYLLRIMN